MKPSSTEEMLKLRTEELALKTEELRQASNSLLALANEQIKAHEDMSKDFINIAAHEIRTPTQSILGYSELLQILFEEEQGDKQAIRGEDSSK